MLAQGSIHFREGDSAPFAPRDSSLCSSPLRQWKAHLQRWRRVKMASGRRRVRALTVVCTQGIRPKEEDSKEVFARGSDRGASQSSYLDDSDVRIASPRDTENHAEADGTAGFGCGESRVNDTSEAGGGNGSARVSLRSSAPISEGWPDSFSSSDYTHISDRYLGSAVEVLIDGLSVGSSHSPKEEVSSSEDKFARAREAGKELVKRTRRGDSKSAVEEGVYYKPKVGDYVMGVVVSGNYGKLDIDIGAKKLAHLFRKDALPLDICNVREMSWELPGNDLLDRDDIAGPTDGPRYVHDEEVLSLALEVTMPVEWGTVFTMEVKALTSSGIAVLSARSVARRYAWQRIRQLQEENVLLEVQITEWTPAGLIAKIEGLRAFLPSYNLVNLPPESSTSGTVSYKEYVGQMFSVMIHTIDEMKSNLVISEKKAWMTKNAYLGAVVDGIVSGIQPYGVHIRIKDTNLSGVLHISNISRARIDDIGSVFTVGEEVRVMVIPSNIKRRISFSTAYLELEDGLMLRDKEAVFQGAERIAAEIAKAYKDRNYESTIETNDNVDVGEQEIAIANWDWLDFGDKANLDYNLPL